MINDDFIFRVNHYLRYLLAKKKDYNLLSKDTWYRYLYSLNRLCTYLLDNNFDSFDDFILAINEWKTKSSVSSTIKKKFIDISFIIKYLDK